MAMRIYSTHLKSIKQGYIKGDGRGQRGTEETFEPGPEMLNRVEFRGIRGKKDQAEPMLLGKTSKLCLAMERSVIHYDHSVRRERGKKLLHEPKLK